MMSHERAVRDARILVSKGLAPHRHQALRDHLRGCEPCTRAYERLRAVEDALTPGAVMAPAAFERMSELVLADVAPVVRRRGFAWLYGLTAATAMAVVMLLVVPRGEDAFTARGERAATTHHGLSVFVIDPATRSASRAAVHDGHVTVPADRLIQLAYRTRDDRHLVVVGIDGSGGAQVYYASESAMPLVANAIDEPLPGAWDVSDVTPPLRLFAFFSAQAQGAESLLAAAQRGDAEPALLIDVVKR